MKALSLSDIYLAGLPAGRVMNLSVHTHANQHGYCHIVLEVSEQEKEDELLSWQQHEVKVYSKGELFFAGVVTDAAMKSVSGHKIVSVDLLSLSMKLDIKKKSRTFQALDKTLGEVAREIASPYHAEVMVENDMVISRMLYQKDETDWMFLRRLCESLGLVIFCDSSSTGIRLSLGFVPFRHYQCQGRMFKHGCRVSYFEVRRRQENTRKQSRVDEFTDTKLNTDDLLPSAGYGLVQENREQAVFDSRIRVKGDFLDNELLLRHKEGLCAIAAVQKNRWNKPCYIPGKVIDVQGQQVKIKFDCDEVQDKAKARWIPHENTVNNYMYSMPDIGDKAFTYFEENGELVALGSHRGDLGDNMDYQNPENRNLTSENQMIQFQPESTVCIAGRDGEQSSSIVGDTSTGIKVISSEDIFIQTPQKITFQAAKDSAEDKAVKLISGFDTGYTEYTGAGGVPLEQPYTLAVTGRIGVDSAAMNQASPAQEPVNKSQSVNSLNACAKGR
ncbi:MAG: hypothetical protein J6O13_03735 [Selenomonas sp.]|nr:hypothetical protein [Selenomonas sp.]